MITLTIQSYSLIVAGSETSQVNLISFKERLPAPTENPESILDFNLFRKDDDNSLESSTDDHNSNPQDSPHVRQLLGHSGPVYGTMFLHETSDLILSCSEDSSVRCWDHQEEKCLMVYNEGHAGPIWSMDVSSLGLHFATGSRDTTAALWDIQRRSPVRIFAGHKQDVDCIRFHSNCRYLATGSSDKSVRIWSVTDGKMLRMFPGHRDTVRCLRFSPCGQYLASAGDDRRIKIWDLRTTKLFKELRAHFDSVMDICYNNDGSLLASLGTDHCLNIWSIDHVQKDHNSDHTKDSFR